jgi:hypothetical protein
VDGASELRRSVDVIPPLENARSDGTALPCIGR